MSAVQESSLLPPLRAPTTWLPPIQVQNASALPPPTSAVTNQGRVVFTRQLWQRTMPDDSSEHGVSTRSHSHGSLVHQVGANISRRNSSNISTRSLQSSHSGELKTPLTPEESPPSGLTKKRNASIVEAEDRHLEGRDATPVHSRVNSGDSASQICLCQRDPKIPRPRNGM
jgi:HMG box factor